jgi:hypothetical protein
VAPEIESKINSYEGGGAPLPETERQFFEPRLGVDLSKVRIHTDSNAADTSRAINAKAFTKGANISFAEGNYAPGTQEGRRLLGHELTHVVQQTTNKGTVSVNNRIFRNCTIPSHCPRDFCRSFSSRAAARRDRDGPPIFDTLIGRLDLTGLFTSKKEAILSGITLAVNSRVVPLWDQHISGGAAPQNLSGRFGGDFTSSPTTADTTNYLLNAMKVSLTISPPVFPAGRNETRVNLRPRINNALRHINTPEDPHRMNFGIPSDIAGNIAGDIGRDQLSCRRGARPSPFNDARLANGSILVRRNSPGSLTLSSDFEYTVRDTIDLCPGDCGAPQEQLATVPISRWEASGIAGDIPFTVRFRAPPRNLTFDLANVTVGTIRTAGRRLRIRSQPNTSSDILGHYNRNENVEIQCQVTGQRVAGNDIWYRTDAGGYISAQYVRIVTGGAISTCSP